METREWRFVDKSDWPKGPWNSEADKMQWSDEATGLPCLIVRHPRMGQLCGYVGVTEGHPAFQAHYDENDVEVHGSLTFADFCQEHTEHGICHVPGPGEPDRVWWLGFDCAHLGDIIPLLRFRHSFPGESYKDIAYVQRECTQLAKQLAEMQVAK